jgi:hypothetical protein
MQSSSLPRELAAGLHFRAGERRKNARFDMHFPIFLRALGDPWILSETADISAAGSFFVTERPFLLNTPIEYVLTFPQELTKASRSLRVRFFGTVLRCERVPEGNGGFGIAVRNTAHRYLTREEGASFDLLDQKLRPSAGNEDSNPARKTGS